MHDGSYIFRAHTDGLVAEYPRYSCTMPDVVPSIAFDIALGKTYKSIDVDYEKVVGLLEKDGVSVGDIGSLTIRVSDTIIGKDGDFITFGEYNSKNNHIILTTDVFQKKDDSSGSLSDMDNDTDRYKKIIDDIDRSMVVSGFFAHELKHASSYMTDSDIRRESVAYKKSLQKNGLVRVLGIYTGCNVALFSAVAGIDSAIIRNGVTYPGLVAAAILGVRVGKKYISNHERYLQNPEEVSARQAAKDLGDFLIVLCAK